MTRLENKHPLAIRWLHWISFPLLFLMIWSGLLIYWANDVYRVGLGNLTLFHFFPNWFYDVLHLPQRLAEGMALHFFFMWLFIVNGIFYVLFLMLSGEWRYLVPRPAILPRRHPGHALRSASAQGTAAPGQVQRRTAHRLHRRHRHGRGQLNHRPGHL